jgi:cytochrome c-type biogenesis protein CcmH
VTLDAALAGRAAPDDTVFIFARAANGPRMPLAILRVKVRDLPYPFALDDSMAMAPQMKISAFAEVVVGARISKSGSATPAAGDLEGASPMVKPDARGINVTINRVVK